MDIKFIPGTQVSNADEFINFKIIIIGDSYVGKSSILKKQLKINLMKIIKIQLVLSFY